mgnify:CR=1 FL=1
MNDKELDQILRKALRPEVSEEELEVWERTPRMESEHTMRRHTIIKSTVAAAACLALVAGIGYGHFPEIGNKSTQQGTTVTKTTPQSVLNSFTVTVSAAEVKKSKASGVSDASIQGEETSGKAQPKIYASPSYDSAWAGNPEESKVDYWVIAPITCSGDNIKSVTYTINKGYFSVVAKKNSKYLIASESKSRKAENWFGFNEDADYAKKEYTSFTVSGTEKPEEKFQIAFVGEGMLSKKGKKALFDDVYDGEEGLQIEAEAHWQLIGDTVITCTATYNDGSQKSVDVKVGTEVLGILDVLSAQEAEDDAAVKGKGKIKDPLKRKEVYTTFEVQQ